MMPTDEEKRKREAEEKAREEYEREVNGMDYLTEEQRKRLKEAFSTTRSLSRAERLRAIPDDIWEAAVRADAARPQETAPKKRRKKSTSPGQRRPRKYKGETIEVACPLCGHGSATRYSFAPGLAVCDGCKKTFSLTCEQGN